MTTRSGGGQGEQGNRQTEGRRAVKQGKRTRDREKRQGNSETAERNIPCDAHLLREPDGRSQAGDWSGAPGDTKNNTPSEPAGYSSVFLNDNYLKYLGWQLYDKSGGFSNRVQ